MSIRNLPFSLGKITNVASRYASFPKEVVEENSVFCNKPVEIVLWATPTPPYASLREARLNFSENELSSYLVRGTGFEPASPYGRYHLKVVRLPVSPPAL